MNNEENTPSKELIDAVADAYMNPEIPDKDHATLEELAKVFNLTTMTVRKMLITAGVYDTKKSREVLELYNSGYNIEKIMEETGLKRNTVLSYIPYSRTVYNLSYATDDAKTYREKRAKLLEEKKRAEEQLPERETEELKDADLCNYPDGIDKLRSAMPFMFTSSQLEGSSLIGDTLEYHGMLMIYGSGNGKSALLHRFILGELPGFKAAEGKIKYKEKEYQVCSIQMYTLLTESSIIDKIAEETGVELKYGMKTAEKRKVLIDGIKENTVLVFNDMDVSEKKQIRFFDLLKDLNAAGAAVIFSSQTYSYEEMISEHSRKKYKDIETLRVELRKRCRTYKLATMTRAEVYKYLDMVEKIYKLQFTMGAREELVELAQEPIRNGNTYFGIQTGCILTMNAIVGRAVLLTAEIRKMDKDGEEDEWRLKRLQDIIKKCDCREVDGNRLITRNLIYYLYRDRTGGMDPNDLP